MWWRFIINLVQVEKSFLTAIFKSALDNEQSLANSEQVGFAVRQFPKSVAITDDFPRKF